MFKRLSSLMLGLVLLALLNACTPASLPTVSTDAQVKDAVATGTEKTESATRGTLRIPHSLFMSGKESLDPASPNVFDYAVTLLYDRLVRIDENGKVAPDLAVSWAPNENATEWTFTLRDDVTFHNGQALSSADVAYTFERILNPATESSLASTLALIQRIETPDPHTVVFQLDQSHADFPVLLVEFTARIIPEGSGDTIGTTGIGTGPFKLETFNAEGTTVLRANDAYWRGAPQLAAIELVGIADAEARGAAMLAGQVDVLLSTTATQASLFADNPAFVTKSFPTGEWYTLVMRTDTPPYDDVRVRKAMRLVADRQAMIDLVLDGQGTVACDTPVAPTDVYHWTTTCPQDIEQAISLLAEAGYGEGLDVTLFTSELEPWMIPLAEVYQQQAAAAGINVMLKMIPSDTYYSEIWLTAPFYPSYWRERPADLILNLLWRSTAEWNESHYQSAQFDQLLDEARQELDFEKRYQLYQQAQQVLFEEGGNLIPFYVNLANVYSVNVSGIEARSYREMKWELISKSE
ncbi:MAG: ABC transporter substrate-binding protein [Caldilineaceae bacterium]